MRTIQMIALIIATIILLALSANAEEKASWFCTDDSAMRTGNTYVICGVGTFSTEGDARRLALENAVNEFMVMCNLSSDCKNHKIVVEPKRSSCYKASANEKSRWSNYSCHRMFLFTIQN